ncbi:hypothetical protein GCM10010919_16150 [Alishewanella longhuensis]|uniref:Uncharacterized protein n=1 Tax=Alishewanella longhuensis TaxID=1091037 RepID=A0ABQ3KYJ1_9ALTE|nr:hypothetical protein GCM10010919_16150 [Alishewanella longhuensis]
MAKVFLPKGKISKVLAQKVNSPHTLVDILCNTFDNNGAILEPEAKANRVFSREHGFDKPYFIINRETEQKI